MQEIIIDYSGCRAHAPNNSIFVSMPSGAVKSTFKGTGPAPCVNNVAPQWKQNTTKRIYSAGTKPVDTQVCSVTFNIPEDLHPPVYMYYRLTNFYQNHRRYVKSLDTNQLKGDAVPASTIKGGDCDPLRLSPDGRPYYPCGLIANSQFNDTFTVPLQLNVHQSTQQNRTYNMTEKGIAWSSDKELYKKTKYNPADIAVPPNWYLRWQNGYTTENPPPALHDDEAFQVWMRTAGLPAFSKLAKRNENETMQCSSYQVDIEDSTYMTSLSRDLEVGEYAESSLDFPVTLYGGTKSIVISTATVMGGRNPFLGIAYVAVGGICIVLGALFTVTHLIRPR